ncbi:uncharacterized protein LOC135389284 [Ornithodoros turicata]|uniref:uncharacterized protein LOC135375880 n=1 Tax=Ornithodoros turicata TaxID=34597 RepID=UPI003138CA61
MPGYGCLVEGCPNAAYSSDIRFHGLPSDDQRRQQWLATVPSRLWQGRKLENIRFCERHFTPSDYVMHPSVSRRLGLQRQMYRLEKTAVPSLNLAAVAEADRHMEVEDSQADWLEVVTSRESHQTTTTSQAASLVELSHLDLPVGHEVCSTYPFTLCT